jgi:hypothetical protein
MFGTQFYRIVKSSDSWNLDGTISSTPSPCPKKQGFRNAFNQKYLSIFLKLT